MINNTPPPKPKANPPGETLPGYKVLSKLGAGGMGVVFKALELKTKKIVSIKILYPKTGQNPALLKSFEREASLLIQLDHPNIVKGYYKTPPAGFNKLHYLVMEYIEGQSIQQIIEQSQRAAKAIVGINEELAWQIIMQVANALDYLQQQNILHRDIKPDNLLIDKRKGIIKLCDLGFAQPINQSPSAGQDTVSATTSGTVAYMSPEQSQGKNAIDIRSDIYSLGATLYHMVTGKTPFAGGDNLELMAKQVLENIQSDEIKNRRLLPLTLYFIEKMMAKEKEIRYQTPRAVISDIKSKIEGYKSLEFNPDKEN